MAKALVVLGFVSLVLYFCISVHKSTEPSEGSLLTFSNIELKPNTTLSGCFVEGKVKNGSTKTLESFVFSLNFVRSNGDVLDTTEANCFRIDLPAGETKSFSAYLEKSVDFWKRTNSLVGFFRSKYPNDPRTDLEVMKLYEDHYGAEYVRRLQYEAKPGLTWNYSLKSSTFRPAGSAPTAAPLASQIIGDWFNPSISNTLRFANGGQFVSILAGEVQQGTYWFVQPNILDIHIGGPDERTNEVRINFFSKDELIVTPNQPGEPGLLLNRIQNKQR